jgi:hypothetical protein
VVQSVPTVTPLNNLKAIEPLGAFCVICPPSGVTVAVSLTNVPRGTEDPLGITAGVDVVTSWMVVAVVVETRPTENGSQVGVPAV